MKKFFLIFGWFEIILGGCLGVFALSISLFDLFTMRAEGVYILVGILFLLPLSLLLLVSGFMLKKGSIIGKALSIASVLIILFLVLSYSAFLQDRKDHREKINTRIEEQKNK
ncbi:MAG: hypothetical protein WC676_05735 [Candidatus Omnitrophota bacterium]